MGQFLTKEITSYYHRNFDHISRDFTDSLRKEIEIQVEDFMQNNSFPTLDYDAYFHYIKTGERMPFEQLYFGKRKALTAFGLYLQWNKNQEAERYFKNLLFDICQEYSWCLPSHLEIKNNGFLNPRDTIDLFAAETAQTLAEILVLFNDCLDPFLVAEIKRNIQQRILTPFENQTQGWESLENNWSAVCGSSVGITALILDPKPEILNRCKQALIAYLRGFGDEGCCTEGISYWVYGFGYYTYFADIYQFLTGESLLGQSKIENIASFPSYIQYNKNSFVPFSDTTPKLYIPSSLQSYFGNYLEGYEVTSFDFDHCYRWAHLSRILWWSKPSESNSKNMINKYFADAQWLIRKEKNVFFAAKGGHNGESHNHNDVGSFVLAIGGELILTDLGAGPYVATYFGKERYKFKHPQSEWHSVPLINGESQAEGVQYCAEVISLEPFSLNIGKAYPSQKYAVRTFKFQKDVLTILDEVEGDYVAHFITSYLPILEQDKIVWNHLVLQFNPGQFKVRLETAEIHNHYGDLEKKYRLIFESRQPTFDPYSFKFSWDSSC